MSFEHLFDNLITCSSLVLKLDFIGTYTSHELSVSVKESPDIYIYKKSIILKNGQTYFKNLAVFTPQDF